MAKRKQEEETPSSSSGKRPLTEETCRTALAHWSTETIWQMNSLLQEGKREKKRPSGAFRRKMEKVLGPMRACFQTRCLPATDSKSDVGFVVADIKSLLSRVAEHSPEMKQFFSCHRQLRVVWLHDETTGGNVLSTDASLKALMFYVSFVELKDHLQSPSTWFPVAMLLHSQMKVLPGGLGQATAAFLQAWQEQALDRPWWVCPEVQVQLRLHLFLSDHDSQRGAFHAKGSAGLKPCLFCLNCVAKHSPAATAGAGFHGLEQEDLSQFTLYRSAELVPYMRAAVAAVPTMTKKERELRERVSGFRLDIAEHGIWGASAAAARNLLSVEKTCNDSMHAYFAKGIAGSEAVSLLAAVQTHTGRSVQEVADAVGAAGWKRPGMHHRAGQNSSWRNRLFNPVFFEGDIYKGSAGQVVALLPLLRFYAAKVWSQVPALTQVAQCFLLLCLCADQVRQVVHTGDTDALDEAQRAHHKAFVECYGSDSLRPKHHHRLHLGPHYRHFQCVPTCWPAEAKHQDFKKFYAEACSSQLAKGRGGGFCMTVLPRLLHRTIELLHESPPLLDGAFELLEAFSEDEVLQATGVHGCLLASKCRVALLELWHGDILLWGQGRPEAGPCLFFLKKGDVLFVAFEPLQLQSCHPEEYVFRKTEQTRMLRFADMQHPRLPAWQLQENDRILCLP